MLILLKYILIRSFEEEDISFTYKLDVMEQWSDTKRDTKRMLNYEPDGCFIAEINGESVGHVFSVSYGRLGWIGLLIVKAEYRRKGIDTLLTRKDPRLSVKSRSENNKAGSCSRNVKPISKTRIHRRIWFPKIHGNLWKNCSPIGSFHNPHREKKI